MPDIIGYLLFAAGFNELASNSNYFSIAAKYNIPMTILSIFIIYESPAKGGGIHLGPLGVFSIPIAIASFVLNLLVVYYLFMGIKDMAEKNEQSSLMNESYERWNQYKLLKIATLFSYVLIFIPPLAVVYIFVIFVISIILTVTILGYLKRCSESL